MDNLSKKQQILLASGLPTVGLVVVTASLLSGTNAIAIVIGIALIPCAAGIWMAFRPQAEEPSIDPEVLNDLKGKVEAIGKSQATIEFNLDGTIITANDNFLNTLGYRLEEIQGKHHSMFVDPVYGSSNEYREFWNKLNRGEYESAEFKRLAKGGREVWIQASYNPIMDPNGKPFKVATYATDITQQIEEKAKAEEIAKNAQALEVCQASVMMADMDMNIVYVNQSATSMLKNRERELRAALPEFNSDRLVGTNVDVFHKQRGMISKLNDVYKTEIEISDLTFSLIVIPWIDHKGERIGTIIEWADRTAEIAIEKEINHLVGAANAGDFTIQLPVAGKEGFFLNLTEGLNSLTATANSGLTDVLRVINSMAEGDLTNKIDKNYDGIFGALKDSVNTTINNLMEVITEIRTASVTLRSGASEIATGNADLSKRTEEQASSLEETASSMEEMTSVVKQGAENSRDANELSQTAKKKATDGGIVVQRAVTAMEEINKSSKEIADIIGVIEEIAFQTNLLALNAAVEAARAGEQGRGFAVVAGEVRNLAQRSADASKEIKDLIRNSEAKVAEGSNLVNESGKTLADIEEAVIKVSAMIEDISAGAEEQTSGIEQVNTAVAQMDEMTQQNAALVEQASASSEAVSDRAAGLAKMVDFFRTGDNSGRHGSYESRPPAPVARAASAGYVSSASSSDDEWQEF